MKTLCLAATVFCTLSFVSLAHAALNTRTGSVAAQVVAIDGVGVPEIVSWTGGEPNATIVLARASGAEAPRKTFGPIVYEPVTIEAALPFSPALQACFSEFLSGAQTKKNLLLVNVDGNGQPVGETLQASGALLTEIQLPALDASTRSTARVKLVFRAESTAVSTAAAPAVGGGSRNTTAVASNFALTLAGLNASGVSKVEAFTLRREPVTHTSGGTTRFSTGPITIPDLSVTVTGTAIAEWLSWRDGFFPAFSAATQPTQGLTAVPYKDGTLQLLSADLRTPLFTLQLTKVGLKRLAQQPVESAAPLKFRAELFCESMSTAPAAQAPAPVPPTATTPTAASPATPPNKIVPRELDPNKTLATKTIAAPATAPANTSPDDKGARDPADFPRPPDVVRTSYSSNREPTLIREYVYYTAKTNAAEVMSFYEKTLESSGWAESSRSEDNSGSGHTYRISSNWKKENRTATLVLGDIAPEKVEIYVALQERK